MFKSDAKEYSGCWLFVNYCELFMNCICELHLAKINAHNRVEIKVRSLTQAPWSHVSSTVNLTANSQRKDCSIAQRQLIWYYGKALTEVLVIV